tara:strand:- start:603 stop:743 length:141 start_codon:yes stop_codon:yes gene_type:complete
VWQRGVLFLALRMSRNFIDGVLVLDASDDPGRTAAATANLDTEYTF